MPQRLSTGPPSPPGVPIVARVATFLKRRRVVAVIVSTVVLAAAGLFILDRTLEAVLRQVVNGYLSSQTLAVVRSTQFAALKIELPVIDLSLLRRRLLLRNIRVRFDQHDGPRGQYLEATAERAVLTGVDLSDLIWHRRFRLDGIVITAPRLRRLEVGPPDSAATPQEEASDTFPVTFPEADSLLYALVSDWLPAEVRQGRVEQLRVNGAVLSSRRRRGDEVTADSSTGLSFEMHGLQFDSTRQRIFERGRLSADWFMHAAPGRGDSLFVRDARLEVGPSDTSFSIAEVRTGPGPAGHALRLIGVSRVGALTIDTLEWAPLVPDSTFFRAAGPGSSRTRATIAGIRLLGLRKGNVDRRRLTAGAILIASASLDLLADYRLPGGAPRRRVLWPARFARLAWVVGVDSIVVDSGRIRYSELRPNGGSPGVVTFDQIAARILNASNDSAAMAAGAVVIQAEARLYGSGPLRARITVPVREGPIRLHAEGRLGEMPIPQFNRFVLPAGGIEITSGTLHEATFSFDVRGNVATGTFRGMWQDFSLRMVDRRTGEQNFGNKLKSLVARLMVKDDNMPDSHGRLDSAPIHYEVTPEDTFWGLLWRSVKSGMKKAVRG